MLFRIINIFISTSNIYCKDVAHMQIDFTNYNSLADNLQLNFVSTK